MKRIVRVFILLVYAVTHMGIFIEATGFSNNHINSGNMRNDIIAVAETQLGYCELTKKDGEIVIDSEIPYYTKYGEKYGNPNGHWCAFFVLWCAAEANIPTSIICKSAACGSCKTFVNWFKSNNRWKGNNYTPIGGDIVFFDWDYDDLPDHVGIVKEFDEGIVVTIEGNTGGENGYMVMQRERTENILGYGIPDYDMINKINGYANCTSSAYMLPDENSETVWEIWAGDELQILCRDGGFYLVLYPYVYTGKFVAAYVPIETVDICGNVAEKEDCYTIMEQAVLKADAAVYHNVWGDEFTGGTRGCLNRGESVEVLFEEDDFFFVRTDFLTGYVEKSAFDGEEYVIGDVTGDKKANSADAGLILRHDAGIVLLNNAQLKAGDVNRDGKVDSADAGLILRYDAKIINALN